MKKLEPFNGCALHLVRREFRRLFFRPALKATDYFSYCKEMGCSWEEKLNALPGRLDTAAILTLPASLTPEGCSTCAAGVEIDQEYDTPRPEHYIEVGLAGVWMLYFQTPRCTGPKEMAQAFQMAFEAHINYDPARDCLAYAPDMAPAFNYGAGLGVRLAFPVKLLG